MLTKTRKRGREAARWVFQVVPRGADVRLLGLVVGPLVLVVIWHFRPLTVAAEG